MAVQLSTVGGLHVRSGAALVLRWKFDHIMYGILRHTLLEGAYVAVHLGHQQPGCGADFSALWFTDILNFLLAQHEIANL